MSGLPEGIPPPAQGWPRSRLARPPLGPFTAFAAFGVFWGAWGVPLPDVKAATGASERELGLALPLRQRSVADWKAATKGASATPGRASSRPSSGKQRGKASVPGPAL